MTRARLERVYRAALAAVEPARCLGECFGREAGRLQVMGRPLAAQERLHLLALGKAGAALAQAAEAIAGPALVDGLVVVPDGCERPLARCRQLVASHPLPDARGAAATRAVLDFVSARGPADVLLVLLSGGTSSLLCGPAPGLELADVAVGVRGLLEAGAPIDALNAVRKHLSAATGGRLACAGDAARVEVLAISDVVDDRWEVIGSGPFAPDPSRYADALAVLARFDPADALPAALRVHLEAGVRGERDETPKPGHPAFARVRQTRIADNGRAVAAACAEARALGWQAVPLTSGLGGEARVAARRLVALADASRAADAPRCWIAGGETVVRVRGRGRGGRCQELALSAALAIEDRRDLELLAAGTDGADGPTDAAGAWVDGESVARGRRLGLDAAAALADNDSHTYFARAGGLLRTGPTGTNVMDLVLLLRDPVGADGSPGGAAPPGLVVGAPGR